MNSKKIEVIDMTEAFDLLVDYFYPTGKEDDELLAFKEYMRDKYSTNMLVTYVLKKEKYHFPTIGAFICRSTSSVARYYHLVDSEVKEFGKRYRKRHGAY